MPTRTCSRTFMRLFMAGALASLSHGAMALDEAAATATARQNNCFNCHAVSKPNPDKDGPLYKDVAAKYKGKPDAVERLKTHLTTGEKAKFPDGHEEAHKIVKVKDAAELQNLVEWILSR